MRNIKDSSFVSNRLASKSERGFILLLTVLITSIILAISLGIYSLTLKELVLSSFLKNSAHAFLAADRATECAIFWDRAPQSVSGVPYTIFATSTDWTDSSINWNIVGCDNGAGTFVRLNTLPTWVSTQIDYENGISSFRLNYTNGSCANVTVVKDDVLTTITADGYTADCDMKGGRNTQRTIVTYINF